MHRKETSDKKTIDLNILGQIVEKGGELGLLFANMSGVEHVWDANGFLRYALRNFRKEHEGTNKKLFVRIHVHSLEPNEKCEIGRYLDM